MREVLDRIYRKAVASCSGRARARAAAASLEASRVVLLAAGKASAGMAAGALEALGERVVDGLVVAKAAPPAAPGGLEVVLGAHPVPDARSARACAAAMRLLAGVPADATALVALSGGASSLLAASLPGLAAADAFAAGAALVRAGLPIAEMNAVRRHLFAATAGRLALACPAPVEVLVLSDVLGSDLSTIASGPFHAGDDTFAKAHGIAARVPAFPPGALAFLARGAAGGHPAAEAPRPGDPRLARVRHRVLADVDALIDAAVEAARREGLEAERMPPTGAEVTVVAATYAARAAGSRGVLCIGGGEPTLAVPPSAGRGGRAQHLALLLARALAGTQAAALLAASDGDDGIGGAAGAFVDGGTAARARACGVDVDGALASFTSGEACAALGAAVVTGPTDTNVLDLHLLWVP